MLSPKDRFKVINEVKLGYPCDYFLTSSNTTNLQLAFVNTYRESSEVKLMGRIRMCVYPDFNNPVLDKKFDRADKIDLFWSPDSLSLLILISDHLDQTGRSYYG